LVDLVLWVDLQLLQGWYQGAFWVQVFGLEAYLPRKAVLSARYMVGLGGPGRFGL